MDLLTPLFPSALYALAGALVGPWVVALVKRDWSGGRRSHFWLDRPSLRPWTSARDVESLSQTLLPGKLMVLGGLPLSCAIWAAYVSLLVGLQTHGWVILMIPAVYVGTLEIVSEVLRSFLLWGLRKQKRLSLKDSTPHA